MKVLFVGFCFVCACTGTYSVTILDGGSEADTNPAAVADSGVDAASSQMDVGVVDVDADRCFVSTTGVMGECETTTECASVPNQISTPGYCPGASNIQCCTRAPNISDNPPIPTGWKLMLQADVTADMTTWAVAILNDPVTYPMFSSTTRVFGTSNVMARVEWHSPDFQNKTVHRGVTLYEPS